MNGEINKKVNKRKYITPNQNGRKSSLRYELEIKQVDEDNEQSLYKPDSLDFFHSNDFDECELEIRNILFGLNSHSNSNSNSNSNDSNENDIETEEIYHFERSKCPDLVF